jgi:osmotically-inducible protein OsmY
MKKGILQLFVAIAVVAGLVGCTSMTGKTAKENFEDATISASVKTNLATDRASTLTAVDVDTVNGTVYLTGTVADQAAKQRASDLASQVDGVARVVNSLQIRGTAAGDAPRDIDVETDTDRDDY